MFESYCKEDSREHYPYNCPKSDADCSYRVFFKDQTQQLILKEAGIHTFRAKTTRLRTRTKRTSQKPHRNGITTSIPEKKTTNRCSEEPPAKKNKFMQGHDRVKFLLVVQYNNKVVFQATRSHFISKLTTIKTFYNNDNVLSLQQRTQ